MQQKKRKKNFMRLSNLNLLNQILNANKKQSQNRRKILTY